MRIGFIGAGKVGFTLGKYLKEKGYLEISGYYSQHEASAKEAASFTDTTAYKDRRDLVYASDIIVITVPDKEIEKVWDDIKNLPLEGKLICHCSGAMTSKVFSGVTEAHAFCYSIHPMYAISSKQDSYKELNKALFTVEGDAEWAEKICSFIKSLGNECIVISSQDKIKYHGAAVFVSNLVTGLFASGKKLLMECGFDDTLAQQALVPLFLGNAANVAKRGPVESLTGPIERNDMETVKKHLRVLSQEEKDIYRALSKAVADVAAAKHPETDYSDMRMFLDETC